MADFPTAKTEAVDNVTDVLAKHINNLEDKVGIDSSADTSSLDYKVNNIPDWTAASAGTIHSSNYVDNDTTYTAGTGLTLSGTEFQNTDKVTWSLEHIHAQQSEGMKRQDDWKEWLRLHLSSIESLVFSIF